MVTQWSRSQEIAKTVHNAAQMPTRMDPQDGKYQLYFSPPLSYSISN